jgi:hypothetical protein
MSVARSGSWACLLVLGLGGLLAGCTTTMQEAARVQLNSARIRASELSTRVHVRGRAVRVSSVDLVSSASATAFVVRVRNRSERQLSDLPISVGVRVPGKPPRYLNAQSGREDFYFGAHLPVIAPGATLTWVYTLHRRLPAAARPIAIVGARPEPAVASSGDLPVVRAGARGGAVSRSGAGARGGTRARGGAGASNTAGAERLPVAVHNLSGVPQYQLQVYAFARRDGRYVAAGSLTVDELDGQASKTFQLGLVGRPGHGRVHVEALPTTLQ